MQTLQGINWHYGNSCQKVGKLQSGKTEDFSLHIFMMFALMSYLAGIMKIL
jgi:hypothetical protein